MKTNNLVLLALQSLKTVGESLGLLQATRWRYGSIPLLLAKPKPPRSRILHTIENKPRSQIYIPPLPLHDILAFDVEHGFPEWGDLDSAQVLNTPKICQGSRQHLDITWHQQYTFQKYSSCELKVPEIKLHLCKRFYKTN